MVGLSIKWTKDDEERLRVLVTQGASVTRASVVLKRNRPSLLKRARDLGCPFSLVRKKLPDAADNLWPRNRVSNAGTPASARPDGDIDE